MIKIIKYSEKYFRLLVFFLKKNWSPCHVLYAKEIFNWQYRIGQNIKNINSLLVLENNKIIGFLGNIPGDYLVLSEKKKGVGLTMWVVDKKYRNSGLGILLIKETEKNNPVCLTLGSAPKTIPLYLGMGFSFQRALNRYILPLDVKGYKKLSLERKGEGRLKKWYDKLFKSNDAVSIPIKNPGAKKLEQLYKKVVAKKFKFSLFRDANFWQWRYLKNLGYKYLFWGNPERQGIIVGRIELTISKEKPALSGLKVFRIIELIPKNKMVLDGFADRQFIALIKGALLWAKNNGCYAADFYCSSNKLEKTLFKIGFKKQKFSNFNNGLAIRFQPLKFKHDPINFIWRIKEKDNKILRISADDSYFVKSDCDMDRPSFWPIPL